MPVPQYLSARQVAALLSCSYDAALRIMHDAGATKIRSLVRIEESVLERYLEACRQSPPAKIEKPWKANSAQYTSGANTGSMTERFSNYLRQRNEERRLRRKSARLQRKD